jgi:hypothetical protein
VLNAISAWNEKDYNKLYVVQLITKIKLNVYTFMQNVQKIKREFLIDLLTSETNEARSLLPENIKGPLSRIKSKKM